MSTIRFPGDWQVERGNEHSTAPPQNIEAEKGVIGGVLLDNSQLAAIRLFLRPVDFFRADHVVLMEAVYDLADRGTPVDAVTLAQELTLRDEYQRIGGDTLIAACIGSVPHAANTAHYAQIVRDKSALRDMREANEVTAREIQSQNFAATEILGRLRDRVESIAGEAYGVQWEEPILGEMEAAAPFPLNALPPGPQRLVADIAEVMYVPPEYAAIPMLTVAGGAIGNAIVLQVTESWTERALLYSAILGPTGSNKSKPLELASTPLFNRGIELHEQFIAELDAHKESIRTARKSGTPPLAKPVLRQLYFVNATVEAIADVMSAYPRGGGCKVHDELQGWIRSINEYKNGKGSDVSFWLSNWSGAPAKVNRRGHEDGIPIYVRSPFLPVTGMLPPGLAHLLHTGEDDGFNDRILVSYPEPVIRHTPKRAVDRELIGDWDSAVRRLCEWEYVDKETGKFRPFGVGFTRAANTAFLAWMETHLATWQAPDFEQEERGHWAKLDAYCARLALILEQLRWAYDPDPSPKPHAITAESVQGAIALVEYFKVHFRRVHYAMRTVKTERKLALQIVDWLVKTRQTTFRESDARDRLRRNLEHDPSELHRALGWLSVRKAIRRAPDGPPKRGRPPHSVYEVNPKLLESARPCLPLKQTVNDGYGKKLILARAFE